MERAALATLLAFGLACGIAVAAPSRPARAAVPEAVTASWYGPGFHGKLAANGSRFDRHAPTVAHKTLAFGTRLRLTDPKTGKTALATVTDRGPFKPGRQLDVSEGLAVRLGFKSRGTAKLLMERVK